MAAVLMAIPLLLFVYMPRPPIPGAHFLVYPMVATILGMLVAMMIPRLPRMDFRVVGGLFLLLIFTLLVTTSVLVNMRFVRFSGPLEVFRIIIIGVFLLYSYWAAAWIGAGSAREGFLLAAWMILSGQAVIAATQLAGVPVFDFMYSAEKSRPFGSLVRATGSVANPNIMGWVVSQAAAWILVLDSSKVHRRVAIGLGGVLVILTGSRTSVFVFPMIILASLAVREGARVNMRRVALTAVLVVAGLLTLVFGLSDLFPYLGELRRVVATGSLLSINSFRARFDHWIEVATALNSSGWAVWLTGLGPRRLTAVLDNDFFYVFAKFGLLGLGIHLVLLAYTGFVFASAWKEPLARIGAVYLGSAVLVGFVADALSGWNYPLFLFALVGAVSGSRAGHDVSGVEVEDALTT